MTMALLLSIVLLIILCEGNPEGDGAFCSVGHFRCGNSTLCVPQSRICDEIVDCPDRDDEIDCDDSEDDSYFDHKYVKRPSAQIDDQDNVCNLDAFNETDDIYCTCKQDSLFCGFKNLTSIPKNFERYDGIDLLHLDGNHFEVLTAQLLTSLSSVAINQLSFAHCDVDLIGEGAFRHLTAVEKLHLDNNNLKTFPGGLFSSGNALKILSVMHNEISWISPNAFENLNQLIELNLAGNKLTTVTNSLLKPLEMLENLYLQENEIRFVDSSTFPPLPLVELSLVANRIESVGESTFVKLTQLKRLYLSSNKLETIVNGTFDGLSNLKMLTLDRNVIGTIETGVFIDLSNVTSLNLEGNKFRKLDGNVLKPLNKLKFIYFDLFEMCEMAPHVRDCHPKSDGISSNEHLLDNPILRFSVWVMAVIGCVGNLIVLFGRIFAPSTNVVHSLYLKNLAFSDFLMAIYLFAIALADIHYRGVYFEHKYEWRHSSICNIFGFLGTLSCESSVLILSLVTWDRYVSVTQPLARKQPSPREALVTLVGLWLAALTVALVPFSKGYFGDEFYGNNGVCLPLHIHEPYAMGWQYSAVMFVLVNTVALCFICFAYLRMIREIKASEVACRSTRQSQEREKVAQRFGVIVLTDCVCWVPVILIKLVALFGCPVPVTLYAWIAIFILPINSALNPILYTLTTTVFKKRMRLAVSRCVTKRKKRDNSASESGCSLSLANNANNGSCRRILSQTQSSLTSGKNSWRRHNMSTV